MVLDPTRHPGGLNILSGLPLQGALHRFPLPFNPKVLSAYDHFLNYAAGDWTVTETQAGATQALLNEQGGILRLTNSAADNDVNQLQKIGESWKLVAGKKTWFESKVRCSDATQTDLFLGLIITDTDIVGGVTDMIGFRKDDGDALIDFASLKNSAGSSSTGVGTLVADTFVTLGFYFDGLNIYAYVNHVQKAMLPSATFVDDEELAITFSLTNGEAVAKTFDIDYYVVGQEL